MEWRSLKSLKGHHLIVLDGSIGTVKDIYFDDHRWIVRYLVADTGVRVDLSQQQIADSPSVEEDKPVSRQIEEAVARHYGWPMLAIGHVGAGLPAAAALEPATAERHHGRIGSERTDASQPL